ncbi:hypothetical protein L484_004085 [Morus notabilis]|uniref:Uncharacterized protein n=1 Tax=Morus notabilis TaxID=981085 RepID=W9QIH2_9ROSA|nr:hypothetical protein L484_004085 [Morus notabilis]
MEEMERISAAENQKGSEENYLEEEEEDKERERKAFCWSAERERERDRERIKTLVFCPSREKQVKVLISNDKRAF